MKLSDLLKKEISYIQDDILRDIVVDTLDNAPECIAIIPASSSGKYHPKADLKEGKIKNNGNIESGGLINHIRTVTAIAHSLMNSNCFRDIVLGTGADNYETLVIFQDAAIAACILHDCYKAEDSDPLHKTQFDHPLKAAKLFKESAKRFMTADNMDYMKAVIPLVHSAISSHMGKWSTAKYAPGIKLPEPKLGIEVFVHLCDYIASRKFIDFNFEVYDAEES